MRIESKRLPQSAEIAISRNDIRDERTWAPQCGQISRFLLSWASLCDTHLRHFDAIPPVHVRIDLIAIVLLSVIGGLVTQRCESRPLTFVSPDN